MADWQERLKDYCEKFAAELGVPFEWEPGAVQTVVIPGKGHVLISGYAAFNNPDPVADAKALNIHV